MDKVIVVVRRGSDWAAGIKGTYPNGPWGASRVSPEDAIAQLLRQASESFQLELTFGGEPQKQYVRAEGIPGEGWGGVANEALWNLVKDRLPELGIALETGGPGYNAEPHLYGGQPFVPNADPKFDIA